MLSLFKKSQAQDVLLQLQKEAIADLSKPIQQVLRNQDAANQKAVETVSAQLGYSGNVDISGYRWKPTEIEIQVNFKILCSLCEKVERNFRRQGIRKCRRLTFGTLFATSPLAMARKLHETDEHLIIFHSGTFDYIYQSLKLLFKTYTGVSTGDDADFMLDDEWSAEMIEQSGVLPIHQSLIHNTLFNIRLGSHGVTPYTCGQTQRNFAGFFTDAVECFIFAHEYAHVLNGDTGLSDNPSSDHNREFLADETAMRTVIYIMDEAGCTADVSYPAVELAFLLFDHAYRFLNIVENGTVERPASVSHPTFEQRKASARQRFREFLKSESAENCYAPAIRNADQLCARMNFIAESLTSSLLDSHYQGKTPAPCWKRKLH